MRSNAMKTCAMGAMLFGGTLGAAQQASAGLIWNDSFTYNSLQGVYDSNGNLAYDSNGNPLYEVVPNSTNNLLSLWVQGPRNWYGSGVGNLNDNRSLSGSAVMNASSASINPVFGPLATYSVSKTAATASGFSMSMEYASAYTSSAAYVILSQAFEVTAGSSVQIQLTLTAPNMQGSPMVSLQKATNAGSPEYPTAEYVTDIIGGFSGLQVDTKGSVTTLTLTEGRYLFKANYGMGNNSSHTGTLVDFAIVPAPGAAALVGLAGLVGGRRRRA